MPAWYDPDYDEALREKFRKFRSNFKTIMDQKLRLHVEDFQTQHLSFYDQLTNERKYDIGIEMGFNC